MKIGDLVMVRKVYGFKNAGKYAVVIGESFDGWWDIMFVDGQKVFCRAQHAETAPKCCSMTSPRSRTAPSESMGY